MSIKHTTTTWSVGTQPPPEAAKSHLNEQQLEDMIVSTPHVLSSDWMIIGRQEQTDTGGRIDLLAIAPDASLVLIELKRSRTPRDIVAQALDYASWVEQLRFEKIRHIYQRFSSGENLLDSFKQYFGVDLDLENLNGSHQIIIVASQLDDSSERIITYLKARNIAIKVLFFEVLQHAAHHRAPQMQPLKKLALTLETLADREHCIFAASDLHAVFGSHNQLPVLLSRAVKAGLLKRVCRGIYLYPKAGYFGGEILFHAAARLRANEFNYISLETALSDAGLISQVLMNWITLMSSGRSHVVNCGEFGHIEFVHTAQRPEEIAGELSYDAARHLWRASEKQALRDMRATRRSMDLVNIDNEHA